MAVPRGDEIFGSGDFFEFFSVFRDHALSKLVIPQKTRSGVKKVPVAMYFSPFSRFIGHFIQFCSQPNTKLKITHKPLAQSLCSKSQKTLFELRTFLFNLRFLPCLCF